MNWKTVNSGVGHQVYALWSSGQKLLTLTFNSPSNIVRLESEGEKRGFTLRYEGFLKNKLVMRNEYGVRIAYISNENRENHIAFNDEKLSYAITEEKQPRIIIYKESLDRPLAECDLNLDSDVKTSFPSRTIPVQQALLLAFCWYVFLPVPREAIAEYA